MKSVLFSCTAGASTNQSIAYLTNRRADKSIVHPQVISIAYHTENRLMCRNVSSNCVSGYIIALWNKVGSPLKLFAMIPNLKFPPNSKIPN